MITIYLKDGTEVQRDGVDARDYVRAGLATYENHSVVIEAEIVINATADQEQIVESVETAIKKRGRPAKTQE